MKSPVDESKPTGPLRPVLVHAVLLAALLALLFPGVVLRGEAISPSDILYAMPPWSHYAPAEWERPQNPIMSDIVALFYPMYYEVARSLERGEWPLWNRLELGGMPLLGNYESAVFYPPRLLFTFLSIPAALSAYILLKLWLSGMMAFVCGLGLGLSRGASRFFSVGWMLATYNVMFAPWSLPDVSPWVPVLFLGVHWIVEGRFRRGMIVASLGATLMLFSGHPELAFGAALGVGGYFLLRLAMPWRGVRHVGRAVGACAVFWFIALAIASVQVVPFLEYFAHSHHSHRLDLVTRQHFNLGNVVAFWVPRFYGIKADYHFWGDRLTLDYSMLYPGVAVWIGVAALLCVRRAIRAPMVLALLATSAVHLALAFQAPGVEFVNRIPLLNTMAPYWYAVFPIFALPLLGAIGLDAWSAQRPPLRQWLAGALVPAAGLGVVAFAFRFNQGIIEALDVRGYVLTQVGIFVSFLAAGIVVAVACGVLKRHGAAVPLLTVLLAADLVIAARGLNPTMAPEHIYPETALTNYLRTLPEPSRIGIAEAYLISGVMAPYGIEEWLGYDGLYPERVLRLQRELGRDIWTSMEPACAIQYYLHDPTQPATFPLTEPGRFTRVATLDGIEVYRNHRALPHAFFANAVEVVTTPEQLFARMKSREFDPRTALLLREEVQGRLPKASEMPGRAEVETRAGTYVRIVTTTDAPQVLVLVDAYYPGWTAHIDGVVTEVFPVDYAFRGVVVPAGAHTVEFVYRPWSFYGSMVVSVAMLVMLAVVGVARLARGNPNRTDNPQMSPMTQMEEKK